MILVTGGTGLLGSHLLFELLKTEHAVKALKRQKSEPLLVKNVFSYYSGDYEKLYNKIIWVDGDITDYSSLEEALTGVEYVYHAAAQVSFNHAQMESLRRINTQGTAHIINASLNKGVKKLCYVSSIATLGRENSDIPLDENASWNKNLRASCYARTKYDAEQEVWRGMAEGLNAVIINPAIILGPGAWDKGSSKLFETVWKGQKFYTKGVNGFVDVRDVAKIMHQLMESPVDNERFILVSEHLSYEDLFKEIAKELNVAQAKYYAGPFLSSLAWRFEYLRSMITGHTPLITKETAYTAHNKHYYNNHKIIEELNYSFIPIKQTIKDTARIFLMNNTVNK